MLPCFLNTVRKLRKAPSKYGFRNPCVPASHRKDIGEHQLDGPELPHRRTMVGRSRFLKRLVP